MSNNSLTVKVHKSQFVNMYKIAGELVKSHPVLGKSFKLELASQICQKCFLQNFPHFIHPGFCISSAVNFELHNRSGVPMFSTSAITCQECVKLSYKKGSVSVVNLLSMFWKK